MKRCSKCKARKKEKGFYARRASCKKCDLKASKQRTKDGRPPRVRSEKEKEILRERGKERRKDPAYRASFIHIDARASDRRSGRKYNLNVAFIETILAGGCSYCDEKEIMITLDSVNNDIGHLKDNVVAACVRCNYMRRDMPYNAWLVVAQSVRKARALGLFGEWTGACHATK